MPRKLILSGIVQGVCCRQYCSSYGKKLRIRGAASNLSDGSVRVLLDTDDNDIVKEYIHSLVNNPGRLSFWGRIDDVRVYEYDGRIRGDYNF